MSSVRCEELQIPALASSLHVRSSCRHLPPPEACHVGTRRCMLDRWGPGRALTQPPPPCIGVAASGRRHLAFERRQSAVVDGDRRGAESTLGPHRAGSAAARSRTGHGADTGSIGVAHGRPERPPRAAGGGRTRSVWTTRYIHSGRSPVMCAVNNPAYVPRRRAAPDRIDGQPMQSTLSHRVELRSCRADGVMGVIVIIGALRLAESFVIVAWVGQSDGC